VGICQLAGERGSDPEVRLQIHAGIESCELDVLWLWYPDPAIPAERVRARSTHLLDLWPMALVPEDVRSVLVAGRDSASGNAVIVRWAFEPAEKLTTIDVDGDPVHTLRPGAPIHPTARLLDEPGFRGDIAAMCRLPGAPGEFLLFYEGTGELHRFSPATDNRDPVASTAGGDGLLQVPELTAGLELMRPGDHVDYGYVITMGSGGCWGGPSIVIVDEDRDGTFDHHLILDDAGWAASGLGRAEEYR